MQQVTQLSVYIAHRLPFVQSCPDKRSMVRRPSNKPSLNVVMRTDDDYQNCAMRLKALADPDRLRIVSCLLDGPQNVSQIAQALGEDLVKVSHHLGVLRHAGVVQTERMGKFIIYCLDPTIAAETKNGVSTLNLGCCSLDLRKGDPRCESTRDK